MVCGHQNSRYETMRMRIIGDNPETGRKSSATLTDEHRGPNLEASRDGPRVSGNVEHQVLAYDLPGRDVHRCRSHFVSTR